MPPSARTVAIFAANGAQMLDISGPLDVFAEANRQRGRVYYDLKIITENTGPLTTSSGTKILPDLTIADTPALILLLFVLILLNNFLKI